LESVVGFLGFVGPSRQPSDDMAADGITAGRIPGDDEPPMEGLMDGSVSSFSGTAPEGDVDSSALHRARKMPDGREGARFKWGEVKGSGNACCSNRSKESNGKKVELGLERYISRWIYLAKADLITRGNPCRIPRCQTRNGGGSGSNEFDQRTSARRMPPPDKKRERSLLTCTDLEQGPPDGLRIMPDVLLFGGYAGRKRGGVASWEGGFIRGSHS
jgi:hypothetical protein